MRFFLCYIFKNMPWKLRSGKVIKINTYTFPKSIQSKQIAVAYFSKYSRKKNAYCKPIKSCLTKKPLINRTAYAYLDQIWDKEGQIFVFHSKNSKMIRPENYYKSKYRSSFQSPLAGYLTLQLENDSESNTTVKFDKIIVKFY